MSEEINKLIEKMKSGSAILFTGAGFSYGMSNFNALSPKGTAELSKLLLNKIGQDIDLPLKDIVDYYISTGKISTLVEILEDEFTIKNVCDYHELIAKVDWKRCYTTNYDFGYELACKNVEKIVKSITPLSSSDDLAKKNNLCIHINGDMNILSKDTLINEFALGDISYVNNSFNETYWHKLLQKDFSSASAIVFIGYSLYDEVIKKILMSNKEFKDKTFIITSPNATAGDLFKLSIYGSVLKIGTELFANEFYSKYIEIIEPIKKTTTDHLTKIEFNDILNRDDIEITKSDINNFLLFGKIEKEKIHKDYENYLNNKKSYFIPRRKCIDECMDKIENKKNLLILSEIGNGKSVLLEQLIQHISSNTSYDIYIPNEVDDFNLPQYSFDIEKINNHKTTSIIICDDINNNPQLLSDYSMHNSDNVILIASIRSIEIDKIDTSKIKFDMLNIDELSSKVDSLTGKDEVDGIIELIDILNFWNHDRISLPFNVKKKLINNDFGNQISETFLDLFSSENMIQKINEYFDGIIKDKQKRDIVFLILLFKYLNIPIDSYIIKGIVKNEVIDSLSFQNDPSISLFYSNDKKSGFTNKSSIFCRTTLKHLFINDYKITQFLTLVETIEQEKTKKNSEKDSEIIHLKDTLIKEIMRFSNIDNLLKERQEKKASLFKYYDNLILKAGWLKYESHYWLQLAMAKITNDRLPDAQKDLDTAYEMAKKKQLSGDYSTSSIDTQQARLFIKKSLTEQHNSTIWDYFNKAHSLLTYCENDKYRYRQVKEYDKFYVNKYNSLSKENKIKFKLCCDYMLKQISLLDSNQLGEYSTKSCETALIKLRDKLNDIR